MVEGCGGIRVAVEPGRDYGGMPAMDVKIHRVAWDRMFFDPHASEPDFSDAGYLGVVIWMNYDDALAQYPDKKEALDTTLSNAPATPTTTSRNGITGLTRSASASESARSGSSETTTGISPSSPRAAS